MNKTRSATGRQLRGWALGSIVSLLVVGFAGPASAASLFVHPQPDDSIAAGEDVRVIAVEHGGDFPADLVLEYSEDCGTSFSSLSDVRLSPASIKGTYEPTALQGSCQFNTVLFRTRSVSEPAHGSSMQVFIES
jgi:hypothetical protein